MSVTLVHKKNIETVKPGAISTIYHLDAETVLTCLHAVIPKNNPAPGVDSRIPSSPAHGDNHKPSRQRAVEENLSPLLKSKRKLRYIGEDNECFELDSVVSFREEYEIKLDSNPWKNFKRLLCGYQDLPFIILQNPTRKHVHEYEEMKRCPTLQWISDVLEEIGLTLEDVVIMDICSLFSDDDLDRMDKESQRTWDAVEKSYAMVEDILEFLKPSMVLSCQCITRWGRRQRVDRSWQTIWKSADNGLARTLCSSQKDIMRGASKEIKVGSNSTLCVYGVHPRRLKFNDAMIPELRGAFKDVFVPCMRWFRRDEKMATTPIGKGVRSLTCVNLVVRAKADSPSARTVVQVAVSELGEETRKLGEQLSELKL